MPFYLYQKERINTESSRYIRKEEISLAGKNVIGQVLFLVEIMEAVGFNQQQSRLASLYLSSSSCAERA